MSEAIIVALITGVLGLLGTIYAESLLPDTGGVGRYPVRPGRTTGWVHVDVRNAKARWTG